MNPCLYINTGFFELLSNLLKEGYDSTGFDTHYKIRNFIFNSKTHVVLAPENGSDDNMYNDFIRVKGGEVMESNKSTTFEIRNETDFENDLIKIGSKSPFSICMVSECNPDLTKFIEEAGYYVINKQSINKLYSLPFLADQSAFGVNKSGYIKTWEDLRKFSHSFNTIIIMDRYLFVKNVKKTRSKFREAISQIVLNLSYNNTSELIDVLLVSVKSQNGDVGYSLREIRETIEKELKDNGLEKEVRVSIARCKQLTDNNHDRLIFTNFCAMHSGQSFNYFERKSLKNNIHSHVITTLSVYSILDIKDWETYIYMLKSRKKELPSPEDLQIPNEDLIEGNIEVNLLKMT